MDLDAVPAKVLAVVARAGLAGASARDVAAAIGYTQSGARNILVGLELRGLLTRQASLASSEPPPVPRQQAAAGAAVVLTARQAAVLACIEQAARRGDYPPSMREIGQAAGLSSTSSVRHQVVALERMGLLRRDPLRPRAYVPVKLLEPEPEETVVPKDAGLVTVPVAERSEDGIALTEDFVQVPTLLAGEGDLVAFTMPDGSMAGAAVRPGDTVVIRRDAEPAVGDLALVLLPNWATTVRMVGRDADDLVTLTSGSPVFGLTYAGILGVGIGGRVVTIMRRL